jgi:hypothetical protein
MKVCTKCGIEKELSEFSIDNRWGKLRAQCKKCSYKYDASRVKPPWYIAVLNQFTHRVKLGKVPPVGVYVSSEYLKKCYLDNMELCPCCGIHMLQGGNWKTSPSVDRLDNNVGYSEDNIWVICGSCNSKKSDAGTPQDLYNIADKWYAEAQRRGLLHLTRHNKYDIRSDNGKSREYIQSSTQELLPFMEETKAMEST